MKGVNMGHDILMFNKNGKEIGYLRFSMWDRTSDIIYDIFDVQEFNGIVSGKAEQKTFFTGDVQRAVMNYKQTEIKRIVYDNEQTTQWRKNEIEKFMASCVDAVRRDGEVTIFFG